MKSPDKPQMSLFLYINYQTFNGGKQLMATSNELEEFSADYFFSMYIYGLYDKEQPEVKSMKKVNSGL